MKVAVTTLAFCVAALLALGLVMLYSSSLTQVGAHYLMMQLIWCAAGFVFCVMATALDYQILKKLAWPLFLIALALLVMVLLPMPHGITKKINGAHRWLILPGNAPPAVRTRQAGAHHHARVVCRTLSTENEHL